MPNKYRPAKRIQEKETTFERIQNYLADEELDPPLSDHEEEVLARYFSVSALADRGTPTEKLIELHCKKHDISRATAFRDLKHAQEVFGNATQVTKQAKRYAVEQMARRGFEQAEKLEDARAMAQQVRNIILINRLDQDDTGAVDPKQIQPPTLLLQLQLPEGKKATFDISKLKDIKDISYEDVLEGYSASNDSEEQMSRYLDELEQDRE